MDTESSLFDHGESIKFAVKGMSGVVAPFGVVQPLQHEGHGVRGVELPADQQG